MNSIHINRRELLAGAGALLASSTMARSVEPSGALRDDIEIVRRALALHPGLYRYQTNAQFNTRLARLTHEYGAASDLAGQFLALSSFTATVRCGHTQCNPYNQRKAVVSALLDRPTRLPYEFAWLDRRMVVLADRSGTERLPRGTEILSINGLSASALLAKLVTYARADGSNDAKRVEQMAMRNIDRFEAFDIYQGLIAPPIRGLYRLLYREPDGKVRIGEFLPLTAEQRRASRHTVETDGTSEPFWSWEMRDGVAILTMPSWVMYNSKWNWEQWLAERLDTLKQAKGLIIDLRENEGGNECGNAILARLTPKDMKFTGYRQLVRFRSTPKDIDPFLDTWDESFRTIGAVAKDAGAGFFDLGTEGSDLIEAVAPRLDLPVAALISPACSSATFSFARRAHESGLVRLFGETSGGNLRGINGNGYFFVRLPGSGLEFDLPIVGNYPLRPQPDRGVVPDEQIPVTIADIVHGLDPQLAAAMSWVRRS